MSGSDFLLKFNLNIAIKALQHSVVPNLVDPNDLDAVNSAIDKLIKVRNNYGESITIEKS